MADCDCGLQEAAESSEKRDVAAASGDSHRRALGYFHGLAGLVGGLCVSDWRTDGALLGAAYCEGPEAGEGRISVLFYPGSNGGLRADSSGLDRPGEIYLSVGDLWRNQFPGAGSVVYF